MRKLITGLVIVGLAASAIFVFTRTGDAETSSYRFVEVEQGDVESVVAATGALNAVTTVQVGTQVSGQITNVYADFNDRVTRGQLIARVDQTLLLQAVQNAEANISRSEAELVRRKWEFERSGELFETQGVTESEYRTAEYDFAVARSNLASAQVNLEQARRNLGYSDIYAPIDGVVIERNVEPGQTVASSLNTPQLFLIANDLAELEILASVDESDIGQIHDGQEARFTVQAYPDESFAGTVRQVRLQSIVQENVVNYTVVVTVQNDDGRLLPGMTATVDFVVERVENVFKVPNSALRFRPNQAMLAELQVRLQAQRAQRATEQSAEAGEGGEEDSGRGRFADMSEEDRQAMRARFQQEGGGPDHGGPGRPPGGGGSPGAGGSQLYYVDADGALRVARVRIGVTDGQYTEITGRNIEAGMQAIASVVVSSAATTPTNPFQQQQQSRGRGRGF
ncbi:MAG: efflux RND transporter periplasmic adaptor subunit [Gemmatimonadota bacterium]